MTTDRGQHQAPQERITQSFSIIGLYRFLVASKGVLVLEYYSSEISTTTLVLLSIGMRQWYVDL